jgi:hypothetical protein
MGESFADDGVFGGNREHGVRMAKIASPSDVSKVKESAIEFQRNLLEDLKKQRLSPSKEQENVARFSRRFISDIPNEKAVTDSDAESGSTKRLDELHDLWQWQNESITSAECDSCPVEGSPQDGDNCNRSKVSPYFLLKTHSTILQGENLSALLSE